MKDRRKEDKVKDYCTWFPENWLGLYIGNCCKGHDSNCSTSQFFKCLYKTFRSKHSIKKSKLWASVITSGGGIGCWARYTKGMFKRL